MMKRTGAGRRVRLSSTILLSLALIAPAVPASAGEAETACEAAIAKAGSKYFSGSLKTINACELARRTAKLPFATNCRPALGAVTDPKTDDKLGTAVEKLTDAINKGCETADLGDVFVIEPCESPADLAELTTCLAEDGYGADIDGIVETLFGDTGDLTSLPDTAGCLKAAAGGVAKLAATRIKSRDKCLKSLAAGSISGPCPDAGANEAMDAAYAKLSDGITKKCSDATVIGDDAVLPGFPCELFENATFRRGAGAANTISPVRRYSRCLAAAGAGRADMVVDRGNRQNEDEPFVAGVAAGDATDSAFIAWTRTTGAGSVTLEVATDAAFTAIVDTQMLTPDMAGAGSVKTEVTGLSPSTQYYYRFTQGAVRSRTGRIRTLTSSPLVESLTFGVTGDSNAYFQPFAVLDQITRFDPEFWLYLGDTIYGDDPRSGTGVAQVRADYHVKYAENRADRALRDLLANVGTYTMWDDHEVTNDFWGTDPAIQTQMTEGSLAFRDYMPIREDILDPMKLYRSFQYGDVAEFFMLDDRQYRAAQADETEPACITGECSVSTDPCTDDGDCTGMGEVCHKGSCSGSGDPCSVDLDCPMSETCDLAGGDVTPNATCQAEIDAPGRPYLGADQLNWLKTGLLNSTATFKILANGPLFQILSFVPYDRWEGYSAEREELLDFIVSNDIKNVVILSTDIHAAISTPEIGTSGIAELVSGAIGMDPILRELPASVASLVPVLPVAFPDVRFFDIDRFNVALVTVSNDELVMQWRDGSGQVLYEQTVVAE